MNVLDNYLDSLKYLRQQKEDIEKKIKNKEINMINSKEFEKVLMYECVRDLDQIMMLFAFEYNEEYQFISEYESNAYDINQTLIRKCFKEYAIVFEKIIYTIIEYYEESNSVLNIIQSNLEFNNEFLIMYNIIETVSENYYGSFSYQLTEVGVEIVKKITKMFKQNRFWFVKDNNLNKSIYGLRNYFTTENANFIDYVSNIEENNPFELIEQNIIIEDELLLINLLKDFYEKNGG